MSDASLGAIERQMRQLASETRWLPRPARQELETLLSRTDAALAGLRVSQLLADERHVRDRLAAAKRDG
jgi:hypothetical protein